MKNVQLAVGLLIAGTLMLTGCGPSGDQENQQNTGTTAVSEKTVSISTSSSEAMAQFMEGRALLDDLHFTDAHAKFVAASESDPDFAMGHLMVAFTALTTDEFFSALRQAEATMANASEGEQLWVKAAVAQSKNYQGLQGEILEELVAKYPDDARALTLYGNYLNGQQDFDGAVAQYKLAVASDPDFAPAYNSMGYAYRAKDDLDDAATAFEKYVAVRPTEANPLDSYAELLLEKGDLDGAIENYRKAIAIEPNFPSAYQGIVIAQSMKGDGEAAQATASEMLAASRNFAERQGAMFRSVTAYIMADDFDSAVKASELMAAEAQAEGDHGALGLVHEYMGDMYLHADDAAKARQHFNAALEHRIQADTNDETKANQERAHIYKMAIAAMVDKDMEKAANLTAEYTAAAEARGNAFEKRRSHALKGYLAMTNDDMAAGAEHLAQANQFNPAVLYWQGVAEAELGNMEKARQLVERAASRNTLHGQFAMMHDNAKEMLAKLSS